jgi:hypothetical protein
MTSNERRLPLTFLVAVFAIALCAAQAVRASEARVNSLCNNPMVLDMNDVVELPGLLTAYGNSAFLNVYPVSPYGNAGAFFGEDYVFGMWIHRTDAWRDLDVTDSLFAELDLPTVYDLFDLYFGAKSGFGLRLSLSSGLDTLDSQTEADDDALYSDGSSAFAVDLAPGYTFEGERYHGDFGAGLTFSYYGVAIDGEEAYTTMWVPSFLIRHRSIFGARDAATAWVLDLRITRRAYTAQTKGDNDDSGTFGNWNAYAIFGPRLQMADDFTIWLGVRLGFSHMTGEITGDKQDMNASLSFPGVLMSGELRLWDVLFVRAGVNYSNYWAFYGQRDSNNDDEYASMTRRMGQSFAWSTGLGVALGPFQIDGTVEQQLYFNGPQFLGGNDPGFLGMISATYAW